MISDLCELLIKTKRKRKEWVVLNGILNGLATCAEHELTASPLKAFGIQPVKFVSCSLCGSVGLFQQCFLLTQLDAGCKSWTLGSSNRRQLSAVSLYRSSSLSSASQDMTNIIRNPLSCFALARWCLG